MASPATTRARRRRTEALVEEARGEAGGLGVGGREPPRKGALPVPPPLVNVIQHALQRR